MSEDLKAYEGFQRRVFEGAQEGARLDRAEGPIHTQDEHCTVGGDGLCVVCGVSFEGAACPDCGGEGFHKPGCADYGVDGSTRAAMVNLVHEIALLENAVRRAVYNLGAEDAEGRLGAAAANALYDLMNDVGIREADQAYAMSDGPD